MAEAAGTQTKGCSGPAYADDKDAVQSAALEAGARVCVARSTLVDPGD